ncbi:MAG: FHA domain-containing protein [Gemmatimonadales bacterium]|nr:FHA domain-containing protein [Gemmatimonadales bacterium]
MAFLVLRDPRSGGVARYEGVELRVGREETCDIVLDGEGLEFVSTLHARLSWMHLQWHVTDLGSTHGTFADGYGVEPQEQVPLREGMTLRFGGEGAPTRLVLQMERRRPVAPGPAALLPIRVAVRETRANGRYEAMGHPVRIGRSPDCELRPCAEDDVLVSRLHATIGYGEAGEIVVTDAGSTNGTLVNGTRIAAPHPIVPGDRLRLGPKGPELLVEDLHPRERRRFGAASG